MNSNPKILFLGHEASRTGAPLLMLELIKWLVVHSAVRPSVLLKEGGELEFDYRAVACTRRYADRFDTLNRVLRKLRLPTIRRPRLAGLYPPGAYPVVYANTIDTCDLALQLVGPGRRLVHHIHELSYMTESYRVTEMLKRAVPVTNAYIAASQAVREFLENKIGVPTTKIQVIHEFPIAAGQNDCQNGKETKRTLRRQLGISDDAFVVGMCGLPHWRKGTDLFVQVAMHVERQMGRAKCHFVWLGGDSKRHREALHDVARTGLQETCHFIPAVRNPVPYFRAFDVFALTSREDPFSVAMLEAAASGLPIVCFAGAGGAPELVEDDAGVVVPYLDIPAMAKACVELLLDDNRRRHLGDNARAKVQSRYTLDIQGPKVLAVIQAAMGQAPTSDLRPLISDL